MLDIYAIYKDARLGLERLTFVKEIGAYRFVGIYHVAAFDFSNKTVVFEKVDNPVLVLKKFRKYTITIEIEESVEIYAE